MQRRRTKRFVFWLVERTGFQSLVRADRRACRGRYFELADLQSLPAQDLAVTYSSRGEPQTHEEDGELMEEDGMARLVVPGDERGGRYVNLESIALLRATTS